MPSHKGSVISEKEGAAASCPLFLYRENRANPDLGRNSLLLDAGIAARFSPNTAVFAYYTGEIGRRNFSYNSINGGIRIDF